MKCGDIVRNYYIGDDNPLRYSIYVKSQGKYSYGIAYDGKRLRDDIRYYSRDLKNSEKYVVVGHIDLIEFLKAPLIKLHEVGHE